MKRFAYLRTLLVFAFRENPLLYVALAVSIASVAIELAAMASLMPLASVAAGQKLSQTSRITLLLQAIGLPLNGQVLLRLFIGLFALRVVSQFAGQGLVLLLSKRLQAQLSTRAFHTLLGVIPLRDIEKESIGSYISLTGDEAVRASALVTQLSQFGSQVILIGLYFVALYLYSATVTLCLIAFLLVTFLTLFEAFRMSHRLGHQQGELSHSAGSLFLDALNGLRSVRAYDAADFVSEGYRLHMKRYMRVAFLIELINLMTRLGPALILFVAGAVATFIPSVMGSDLGSFPFLVTIIIILLRFFPVVGQTLNIGLRVVSDARSGRDVTALIRPKQPRPQPQASLPPPPVVQDVSFRSVGFSYSPDKPVLADVNLTLRRGRCYALIGRSGSGKSTLMDILLGFYKADSGIVSVDGVPAGEMTERDLRRRILLVSQETTIFNDTIGNNIRFGITASDDDIRRACRIACIDDFIDTLPAGLNTVLQYRGTNLSGGQRQRIGLARAILRQAPVLVLDESTSALDKNTRTTVVANLRREYAEKIIVFVTHDAEIVAEVDEVLDLAALNRIDDLS